MISDFHSKGLRSLALTGQLEAIVNPRRQARGHGGRQQALKGAATEPRLHRRADAELHVRIT